MLKSAKKWAALLAGLMLWVGASCALALEVKPDAPTRYTVKKNDTLWDIAGIFLDKPWLWPELWRNNTQILNPHLIYPGDVLILRIVDGEPVLDVVRQKTQVTLSPNANRTVKQGEPINLLPWSVIEPYIQHHEILDSGKYEILPHLLGNKNASIRFVNEDLVMRMAMGFLPGNCNCSIHSALSLVATTIPDLSAARMVPGALLATACSLTDACHTLIFLPLTWLQQTGQGLNALTLRLNCSAGSCQLRNASSLLSFLA